MKNQKPFFIIRNLNGLSTAIFDRRAAKNPVISEALHLTGTERSIILYNDAVVHP